MVLAHHNSKASSRFFRQSATWRGCGSNGRARIKAAFEDSAFPQFQAELKHSRQRETRPPILWVAAVTI